MRINDVYTNMYEEDLSRHAHCTCASHVKTCHDMPTVHVHHIIIMRSLIGIGGTCFMSYIA